MDVYKALRELHEEKDRLDAAIEALEGRVKTLASKGPRARRGRRSMSADERAEVSKRMSRYWASRRNKDEMACAAAAGSDASPAGSQAIREVA